MRTRGFEGILDKMSRIKGKKNNEKKNGAGTEMGYCLKLCCDQGARQARMARPWARRRRQAGVRGASAQSMGARALGTGALGAWHGTGACRGCWARRACGAWRCDTAG